MNAPESDSALLRAFVAVAVCDEVRHRLAELQERLRRRGVRFAWVAPDNLHITMAFLGDVPGTRLPELAAALTAALTATRCFTAQIAGLGCFGPPRKPRVLWAGVTQGAEALVSLEATVRHALAGLGFRLEARPFTPHLTLARVRPGRLPPPEWPEILARFRNEAFGATPVDRVLLMRSQLRPEGPAYSLLHAVPLVG